MYFYGLGRVFEYFCDISRFSQRRKQFSDFEKEFFLRKQSRRSVVAQEGSRRDEIYERIGWLHNFLQPFSYLDVKQASISHCCYSTAVNKQDSSGFLCLHRQFPSFIPFRAFLLARQLPSRQSLIVKSLMLLLSSLFLDFVEQKKSEEKNSQIRALDKNKTRREFSRQSSQLDKFSAVSAPQPAKASLLR